MTTSLVSPETLSAPIINPITFYLNESARLDTNPMNKTTLAEHSKVDRQTIHKAQMGLYSALPSKLTLFMAANPVGEADHSVVTWNTHYKDFIKYEMKKLKVAVAEGTIEAEALFTKPESLAKYYPTFTDWRKSLSYSQIDFCKTFLLHQAIVSKYEAGQMKNMAQSIVDRLRYLGLSSAYIVALENLPVNPKVAALGRKPFVKNKFVSSFDKRSHKNG